MTVSDEGVTIEDLGTVNGTAVNGEALAAATPLESGAEVDIGQVRRFELVDRSGRRGVGACRRGTRRRRVHAARVVAEGSRDAREGARHAQERNSPGREAGRCCAAAAFGIRRRPPRRLRLRNLRLLLKPHRLRHPRCPPRRPPLRQPPLKVVAHPGRRPGPRSSAPSTRCWCRRRLARRHQRCSRSPARPRTMARRVTIRARRCGCRVSSRTTRRRRSVRAGPTICRPRWANAVRKNSGRRSRR